MSVTPPIPIEDKEFLTSVSYVDRVRVQDGQPVAEYKTFNTNSNDLMRNWLTASQGNAIQEQLSLCAHLAGGKNYITTEQSKKPCPAQRFHFDALHPVEAEYLEVIFNILSSLISTRVADNHLAPSYEKSPDSNDADDGEQQQDQTSLDVITPEYVDLIERQAAARKLLTQYANFDLNILQKKSWSSKNEPNTLRDAMDYRLCCSRAALIVAEQTSDSGFTKGDFKSAEDAIYEAAEQMKQTRGQDHGIR